MAKKPIILGLESSCDETAAAVLQDGENGNTKILSNIISSQFDIHKEFGGVVPELAARSHLEKIDLITNKALEETTSSPLLRQLNSEEKTAAIPLAVAKHDSAPSLRARRSSNIATVGLPYRE